jgi:uncharacterized protein YdcH (DUF465 family)
MSATHHDFVHEFPEYKMQVHELKLSNMHFAKLFNAYQECNNSLHRIELEIETPSDAVVEELKKKRLHLKDEMLGMIKQAA